MSVARQRNQAGTRMTTLPRHAATEAGTALDNRADAMSAPHQDVPGLSESARRAPRARADTPSERSARVHRKIASPTYPETDEDLAFLRDNRQRRQ